jgi:ABC-type dipeptide/oligopeptide/nickel transport system ATPase subunit
LGFITALVALGLGAAVAAVASAAPAEARPLPPPAQIILPSEWTGARRRERIREVLAEVGLAHAHRTIVGGTLPGGLMMRGLSGGERKRLAIATGILAAPSVLYLDGGSAQI